MSDGVYVNKAETTFKKSIPFKVYMIEKERVSGTSEHTHDYMQIWYVMSGCCEHQINNRSYSLAKGNIFVIPPFVVHSINVLEGNSVKIMGCEFSSSFISDNIRQTDQGMSLFDFAYLEPFLVSNEDVKPRLHLTGKSQAKVEELMQDMLEEFSEERKYYEIHIKADLLKLLAIVTREYENQDTPAQQEIFNKYREAVHEAVSFINENYVQRIYIEDVCKIAMMSQTYFSYIFKNITGKTFIEYVNSLRISKAITLLRESDKPITEICYSTGFNDAAYFNKVFKKETGLSPKQYRAIAGEGVK